MSAFVTSKLGKLVFGILSISGASLLTANILSSALIKKPEFNWDRINDLSSLIQPEDHELDEDDISDEHSLAASEAEIASIPIIHKKFKVVLTSKNDNYKVLISDNSQGNSLKRFKTWYLFDKSKNYLEKIDGLTAKNDISSSRSVLENEDNINKWLKSKQWQGYRGQPWSIRDKKFAGSPFELKYVSEEDSVKFPFLDYLKFFCKDRKHTRGYEYLLNSRCSRLDIPFVHFRISPIIKQNWQKSFPSEKDICLVRESEKDVHGKWKFNNWKEQEKCEPQPIEK